MTTHHVILFFAAGAASLAVWVDVRFPRLGPTELRGVVVHAVCAYGLFLSSDALYDLVATSAPWTTLGGIFLVHVPILVYMLIVCFWVLKVVRGALSSAR